MIRHLICGNNLNWFLNLSLIYETLDWVKKWLVDFNVGKAHLVSFDWSNNTGSNDMKMDGHVLEEKSSFKMLGLTFYFKLDWSSHIISISKTTSKRIGALFRSMKFRSLEVALYLNKSTLCPCLEYCCHIWAGAPSCYLELLDKLQKQICMTVGLALAAFLEPLAHQQNMVSLSLSFRYYFLFLKGGLHVILIDCMIFLSPFQDVTRMSMSTVSFLALLESGICAC